MEKQHRINWRKGMEITPKIFIQSDNYHIAARQLLERLLASRSYGLFPNSNFMVDYELHNNHIEVKISDCIALLKDGYVINVQDKTSFKSEFPLDETAGYYVVLSAIPDDKKQIDENALHIVSQYELSFKKTNETIESGIPVLKICRKQSDWEVDANYIPPAIALNSVPSLINKYTDIKNVIYRIIDYYAKNDVNYLHLMMLQIELNNFSDKESPERLTVLMQKFCWIFQEYLKTVKEIDTLQNIKKFMALLYNHHEIAQILDTGYESLIEIVKILEAEPKEIPEIEEINV